MHAGSRFILILLWATALAGLRLSAADSPVTLSSPGGAAATFTQGEAGWNWTALTVPGRADQQVIDELGYHITTAGGAEHSRAPARWNLVQNGDGQVVLEQTFADAGIALQRRYSFGPADNVLRIETWARSTSGSDTLNHVTLLSAHVLGRTFAETGIANQSFPLFATDLFVGIEHVSGECHAWQEVAYAAQSPHLPITAQWKFVAAVVVGWPVPNADLAPGQSPVRAAFLHYLDTIRIKPKDLELHTNTWWTLPLPFTEEDVLRDIDALREGFYERTGMFFDSYALDLGWSSRHSIWQVDEQRFPDSFRNVTARLADLNCRLGLWASPGSAYPEGLDNAWLKTSGYEVTPSDGPEGVVACFAAGTKYHEAVKDSLIGYAREFGLGHVKLDYMAHNCDASGHGHPVDAAGSSYAIDAGLADVLDGLRAVNPDMALEPLVCGYPPSPWWTMHTPYMLGPNGDDVPSGRVPCPEWMDSLITARDVAYRSQHEKWIMPTQALETFDIVLQTPGEFKNMAVMAIGRGRWFISTYLRPELMKPDDWDFLAALVRWARANRQYLGNAQMIGGAPEKKEAYGYVFHTPEKDIYCVRNPWLEQRTIQLPATPLVTQTRDLQSLYPRHATIARVQPAAAGPKITLAPYETMILETVPTNPKAKIITQPARPSAVVNAVPAQWTAGGDGLSHYVWGGTVDVPQVNALELLILVQGDPTVSEATARVTLDGEPVTATKTGSAGQFYAAGVKPENWTWFRVPVSPGSLSINLDVSVPARTATVGVYLRGRIGANRDASLAGTFPEFRADERGWSQALAGVKAYALKAIRAK